MIRRKLVALKYTPADSFDINDEKSTRNLISFLEEQRICFYSPDDRAELRNVCSPTWNTALLKYLDQLGVPAEIDRNRREDVVEWLVSVAIRYAYNSNSRAYSEATKSNLQVKQDPKMITANPLDKLDFGSTEFVEGVRELANHLGVTNHPNHLVTLEAIATLVHRRMSTEALGSVDHMKAKGKPWPFMEIDMGFESGDYVTNQASKILRLLYIHDLRNLQTKINECIVAVQIISANPKTDAALGKTGY